MNPHQISPIVLFDIISFLSGFATWIGGIAAVAFFSTLIALLLEAFTPEGIREPVKYRVRQLRRWWDNDDMTFWLTNSFHLRDSIEKDEASPQIRADIDEFLRDRGYDAELEANEVQDRFEIELDTSRGTLFFEIGLDATPGGEGAAGLHGATDARLQTLEVTTVRATAQLSNVEYRDFRGALETCDEYVNAIGYSLSHRGHSAQKGVYSISCRVDTEPTLSKLLANLDVSEVTAKGDGKEIEIDGTEILVRNVEEREFATVLDTLKDLIIYYG